MILGVIGGLLGMIAAIAYTALIMYGLRTWWIGAVGTTDLRLHASPVTMLYGFVGSLLVALLAILWAAWHVGRTSAATLRAGGWGKRRAQAGIAAASVRWIGIGLAIGAAQAMFASAIFSKSGADETFLSGGALLLIGCLCWLGGVLRPGARRPAGPVGIATIARLGMRNASRHTARSVLAIGLIAFAAFTLITVAAFKLGPPADTGDVASGAGGFRLILSSGIPLRGDLNTLQGRRVLGMTDADDPLWSQVRFVLDALARWASGRTSVALTSRSRPRRRSLPSHRS